LRWLVYIVLMCLIAAVLPAILVRGYEPPGRDQIQVRLFREDVSRLVELDLEEYVAGVVAAEMPAVFHLEALKAQAVAARTYALRAVRTGGGGYHLTSSFQRDQAWVSLEGLREKWGAAFPIYWSRIRMAVRATRGEVLTYRGELIFPAYHSTSGGQTEDSENYWSALHPYLRSTPSPYEEHSPHYRTEQEVPWEEIARSLGLEGEGPAIEILQRYPSGRVQAVAVGGKVFTGRQVREALGLRSNWFDVAVLEGRVRFSIRGNGHGVGMSQYGADGMARQGYNYREILAHYYRGTKLMRIY
jgi:stage II sporulation protein D